MFEKLSIYLGVVILNVQQHEFGPIIRLTLFAISEQLNVSWQAHVTCNVVVDAADKLGDQTFLVLLFIRDLNIVIFSYSV